MEYIEICEDDYSAFHELASAYYREGEDADTPQEEIDAFIRFLFDKVVNHKINGYIAKEEHSCVGFVLWGVDAEGFEFSEMPGFHRHYRVGITSNYINNPKVVVWQRLSGCSFPRDQFLTNAYSIFHTYRCSMRLQSNPVSLFKKVLTNVNTYGNI